MNWGSLGRKLIEGGSSLLGGALLGPQGAMLGPKVGGFIADLLGVPNTPDAIEQAIAADPAALARIRTLEIEKESEIRAAFMDAVRTEEREITKRHGNDMASDSWLSKNVRPLTLVSLVLQLMLCMILDSALETFTVRDLWVEQLVGMLESVMWFYFGGRTLEKGAQMLTGRGVLERLRTRGG